MTLIILSQHSLPGRVRVFRGHLWSNRSNDSTSKQLCIIEGQNCCIKHTECHESNTRIPR